MDSQVADSANNFSPEELLAPPRYDPMGILMTFLSSLIVGVVSGIIIMLASYFAIGRFTLESGASPILLVFVAFVGLTIGNLIYVSLLGYIFPHVFGRHRTSFSQVMIASIVLYIFFIPVYTVITTLSAETRIILIAFSAHTVFNAFTLNLLMGIISRYRYSILSFYSSIISMLLTVIIIIFAQTILSKSETALLVLLGLPILAYVLSGTMSTTFSWVYYKIYQTSGSDPLGSVFGRIEEEERAFENEAIKTLTQFQTK